MRRSCRESLAGPGGKEPPRDRGREAVGGSPADGCSEARETVACDFLSAAASRAKQHSSVAGSTLRSCPEQVSYRRLPRRPIAGQSGGGRRVEAGLRCRPSSRRLWRREERDNTCRPGRATTAWWARGAATSTRKRTSSGALRPRRGGVTSIDHCRGRLASQPPGGTRDSFSRSRAAGLKLLSASLSASSGSWLCVNGVTSCSHVAPRGGVATVRR